MRLRPEGHDRRRARDNPAQRSGRLGGLLSRVRRPAVRDSSRVAGERLAPGHEGARRPRGERGCWLVAPRARAKRSQDADSRASSRTLLARVRLRNGLRTWLYPGGGGDSLSPVLSPCDHRWLWRATGSGRARSCPLAALRRVRTRRRSGAARLGGRRVHERGGAGGRRVRFGSAFDRWRLSVGAPPGPNLSRIDPRRKR
jgi:hypothetical protein